MPTITFDVGGADLVLPCQRAGKAAKRRVGEKSYAFVGDERTHIRGEYLVIPLVLTNADPSDCAAVEALFAKRAKVPCAGDVFNNGGATVVCSGDYTDDMEQGGTYRVPGITLYEATRASGFGGVGGIPASVSPDDPPTGGCIGTGPVLSSPMSDDFDCGTAIDTTGTRFLGAHPWTVVGIDSSFSGTVVSGGQLLLTMSGNGFDWHPKGAWQALPAGDWTFETDCGLLSSGFGSAVGILLVESSTGKQFAAHFFDDFGFFVGAGSETGLGAYGSTAVLALSGKIEVARISGNLRMRYDIGAGWVTFIASAPQTGAFTTAPDQVYVFEAPRRTPGADTAFFNYFYRTA